MTEQGKEQGGERGREWMHYVAAPGGGVQALHAHFYKHSYERHSHDVYVLGTIDAGAPDVGFGKRRHVVPPGCALIINPGEAHDGRPSEAAGYVYSMVYVERAEVQRIADDLLPHGCADVAFTSPVIDDPRVVHALHRLHRALFQSLDPLESEVRLIDALCPLLRRHSSRGVLPALPKTGSALSLLARVRECMHAEYQRSLTTTELAELAGVSRVRLNQLFAEAYGLPLHAYLNRVRLQAACRLLRQGDSAAEVASAVGLTDQSHLIRRFKGSFGITPAQYARAHFTNIQYGR